MYSNMVSRQWFIGVKSNTDKQKNRLRHPYTDFKSRRAKFAATVDRINLCENFVPPSAAAVRRVAAPYKVRIIRHRSHKSSRLNAALAGLVDGRAVMGTFVCGRMNLS